MKTINLGDIRLPLEAALQKIAILAKSGAGKSTTAADVVEEVLDAGVQVCIVDPKGDWWGLKSSADGKEAGYPVVVLGGQHSDAPLEAAGGRLVAQAIVESTSNFVLDVSAFTQGDMYRFIGDFAQAFFQAKQTAKRPILLVLDEADEMAPQKLPPAVYGPAPAICLNAIEKIVKRGRFLGIGVLVITQRSASLNKDVLTQADILIAMRTTAPHDIKPVDAWLEHHADQEKRREVLTSIQGLATGEGYVYGPELNIFKRVKFRPRRTFDAGRTPRVGEVIAAPKRLAEVDLGRLRGHMAALAEKVKADDPALLKKRIRELEAATKAPTAAPLVERVEVSILRAEDRALLEKVASVADDETEILQERWREVGGVADRVREALRAKDTLPIRPAQARPATPPRPAPPARDVEPSEGVSRPQQRILDSLAWLAQVGIPDANRTQLALLADASPTSSAYANNLGSLRTMGLIEYPAGNTVRLTAQGDANANVPAAPPTTDALHETLRGKLSAPQWRILQALITTYPKPIDKETLARDAEASPTSSAYANNLGALRSLGFIDYPAGGQVVALPVLFLDAR